MNDIASLSVSVRLVLFTGMICVAASAASAESLRASGDDIRLYRDEGGVIRHTSTVLPKGKFDASNTHVAARDQTPYLGVEIDGAAYWVKAMDVDTGGRGINCPKPGLGRGSPSTMSRSNGAGGGCR